MKGLRSILALIIALLALGACSKHHEPPAAESSSAESSSGDENTTQEDDTFLNGDESTGQKINGSEDTSDKAGMY